MAPPHGAFERLLPERRGPRAAVQQGVGIAQGIGDLRRRQRARPAGRQFQGQRQAIQPVADTPGPDTRLLAGPGVRGVRPAVAEDESADPRDRELARWLNSAEKVVFSTTLTEAPWQNSRITDADPVEEVRRLRKQGGGDIVVLSSSSLIRALIEADEIDRLQITQCPELVGGGPHLFEDGIPSSSWSLTDLSTAETGAICLVYDRIQTAE